MSPRKGDFRTKTEKNEHHNWILHIWISLSNNFQLKLIIFIFWTNLLKNGSYSQSKNWQHHWILNIRISLPIKFHFEQTVLNFWTKFDQEGYLWSKIEKGNIIIEFHILELVLVPNFSSNWQFWFFGLNLPKNVFLVQNRKSKYHHVILHIRISLSSKFQLKLTILSFWTKFTQKWYFQSKAEQADQGLQAFAFCEVNLNSTVVFEHFEHLKNLIVLNILKWKVVISCLLGSFYFKVV